MSASSWRRVSRRGFLRGAGATAGLVAGGAWLSGCAPTSGTPPPAKPTAGAAPTGAPAAVAKPSGGALLKIGLLQPYSGVYTQLGESTTNGMQLYLDSVDNRAVAGRSRSSRKMRGARPTRRCARPASWSSRTRST